MSKELSVLFLGDIVASSGMEAVKQYLPLLKEKYLPDFIFANGENADQGKGITQNEAVYLFEQGISVITTGNHIWDNWYSKPLLQKNPNVLRPLNYPSGNVGNGLVLQTLADGTQVMVINLQGRTFMQTIDCPMRAAEKALEELNPECKIILVDFHADATAEKQAMGWFLEGKVSALIGTHTHVQTADAQILPRGTAYISDAGMCGSFDSVVGMNKKVAINRLYLQIPFKYEEAKKDLRVSGVHLLIDKQYGRCMNIESFVYPEFNKVKSYTKPDQTGESENENV